MHLREQRTARSARAPQVKARSWNQVSELFISVKGLGLGLLRPLESPPESDETSEREKEEPLCSRCCLSEEASDRSVQNDVEFAQRGRSRGGDAWESASARPA